MSGSEQGFERAESEQLVDHVDDERVTLAQTERGVPSFAVDQFDDEGADLGFRLRSPDARQSFEVQSLQQLLMDVRLQILVFPLARSGWRDEGSGKDGTHHTIPQS
jgi:hypothetical protein